MAARAKITNRAGACRQVVLLVMLGATSCTSSRTRVTTDGNVTKADAGVPLPAAQPSSERLNCKTTVFMLPSLPGWQQLDIAPEECVTRDYLWLPEQRARLAFCGPGPELEKETLLPHAATRVRLSESRGRDALVNARVQQHHGLIDGEIGVRFLSEGGAAWGWLRFDNLPLAPAREVLAALLHAQTKPFLQPRERSYTWDLYQQECFAVKRILEDQGPLRHIPTYPDPGKLLEALLAASPAPPNTGRGPVAP